MKLLVIGIDGGDKRVFDAMEMPALHAIMDQSVHLVPTEDVWSRGWSEILYGLHGRESGQFYVRPKLDGTHHFTHDMPKLSGRESAASRASLPERMNELGAKVGFMNVPMDPPGEVNGFFVPAAESESLHNIACHPDTIKQQLEKLQYIPDCPITADHIERLDELFDRLGLMTGNRATAFVQLCKQYLPDVGFLVFSSVNHTQNLAMSELEPLIMTSDIFATESAPASAETDVHRRIRRLFQTLDGCIQQLVESLSPENVMVVGDHGVAPYLHRLNPNRFLLERGWQAELRGSELKRFTKRLAKSVVPARTAQRLARKTQGLVQLVSAKIDWERTRAFGSRYVPGIYLNDANRFRGPVSAEQGADLIHQIVEAFNQSPEASRYEMQASPYREQFRAARFESLLPDIWIDKPDSVFVEGDGDFVTRNRDYGPIRSMRDVGRDMFTGVKGRFPACCVRSARSLDWDDEKDVDLTVAYDIIEQIVST